MLNIASLHINGIKGEIISLATFLQSECICLALLTKTKLPGNRNMESDKKNKMLTLAAVNINGIKGKINKHRVKGANPNVIKRLDNNLIARIQTRYRLTKEVPIKDRMKKGEVLSVVEYVTHINKISKELRDQGVATETGCKQ